MEGDISLKTLPPSKKGRLRYKKCTFCRKDKKKCEPNNREWPGQKCGRCIHLGRECSENVRATEDSSIPSLGKSTLTTKGSEKTGQSLVEKDLDALQDWDTLRALSAHSSWITHIERVCDSVRISEAVYAARLGRIINEPDLTEIESMVFNGRQAVRATAKQAMGTPQLDPMVRYVLASVLKSCSFRSYEGRPRQIGVDCFDSQEDIAALVQELQQSGDLGYAISIQESYLNGLGAGTQEDVWKTELKRYYDSYQHLRSAFRLSVVEYSRLPRVSHDCLPFLETTSVRQAAIKYIPHTTAKDIFGRTLLHIALYNGHVSGVDGLIGRLSKSELNAKDFFGRTPLHIAATFGLDCAVHCLLEAGVDASPCESSFNLTPLQCAAAAGQERAVARILARLMLAKSSSTASWELNAELQAACRFASRNQRYPIVHILLPHLTRDGQDALRSAIASASVAQMAARKSAAPVSPDTGSG